MLTQCGIKCVPSSCVISMLTFISKNLNISNTADIYLIRPVASLIMSNVMSADGVDLFIHDKVTD